MAKDIIGIEIGNHTAKFAEMRRGKLNRFVSVDLPDNIVMGDNLVSFEAMTEIITNTLKANRFSVKNCALVLPDNELFLRRLTLPAMTEKQLLVNMPYEFSDLLVEPKENYLFDYSVIQQIKNEEGEVKELEILGAAVHNELIEKYEDMFKKASLKFIKAAPRETVLSSLVENLTEPKEVKDSFAVLDLGYSNTRVDIFKKGVYEVTRTIETGLKDAVDVVADVMGCDSHVAKMYLEMNKLNVQENERCVDVYEQIAIEVMRAMNYYSFENPDDSLKAIYYCGGGSYINRFVEEIKGTIDLEFIPLSALMPDNPEAIMKGASAIGICYE